MSVSAKYKSKNTNANTMIYVVPSVSRVKHQNDNSSLSSIFQFVIVKLANIDIHKIIIIDMLIELNKDRKKCVNLALFVVTESPIKAIKEK